MDVVELTKNLVAIPSVSRYSNRPISDFIAGRLRRACFELEEITYTDQGEEKVSLVARRGSGTGGIGFFSHSDTVPGGEGWEPYEPFIDGDRLYGRGSCDMKGALAASIAAMAGLSQQELSHPVFIVVTSDEEQGHKGAQRIVSESETLRSDGPAFCVVCEPTQLIPIYAHKGVVNIQVTALGVAAHSSTDEGESANLKIAPFLAEMAALAQIFRNEERFMNTEFDPPTNGFNLVIDDGGTARNITAAKTVCTISIRVMPDAAVGEAVDMVTSSARAHGLEVVQQSLDPFCNAPHSALVQAACRVTGAEKALTVPFGTEASAYQKYMDTVVLGPGNIAQAHTVREWVAAEQLERAVSVYRNLVAEFCL